MGKPDKITSGVATGLRFLLFRPYGYRIGMKLVVDLLLLAVLLAVICCLLGSGAAGHVSGVEDGRGEWGKLWQFIVRRNSEGALAPGFLLIGLGNTLRISFWALLLAAFLGLLSGFGRAAPWLFTRMLALSYVGLVRNIPPLVLIFIIYFFVGLLLERLIPWDGLAALLGEIPGSWLLLPQEQLSSFFAAVLALGLYEGAYFSEVVRAGISSVPKGQWEAAASLGLPRRVQMLSVVLPQAFRLMLPPTVGQTISLVKESSIVSVISVRELTFQGRELINATYMVLEVWLTVTLCYLLISLCFSGLGAFLERRMRWQLV